MAVRTASSQLNHASKHTRRGQSTWYASLRLTTREALMDFFSSSGILTTLTTPYSPLRDAYTKSNMLSRQSSKALLPSA